MLNIFSWWYILFVLVSVVLYWVVLPKKIRPYFLLAAGLAIVLFQNISFSFMTLAYLTLVWYFGFIIHTAREKSTAKFFLISGISLSALLLAYYKYYVFGDVHALSIAGSQGISAAVGPLGISYFTFRVIHYLVEVYRGKVPAANYFDFLLYITFFPTILAGPIDRIDNFQPQREAKPDFSSNDFFYGLGRIAQGLFKKLVVSATLYQMCTPYYAAVTPGGEVWMPTWQIWLIHNIYLFYLYMDFSGYSDIAIGTARLFGYRVMENFNWPVFQPNIAKFWASWHISLTRWLQEYIYFALGGNKKGLAASVLFSFITMGLFGLWHGSGAMGTQGIVGKTFGMMHYICFGFFHATVIVIYRFWRLFKKKNFPNMKKSKVGYVIGVILTYQAVCLAWPFFLHPVTNAVSIYAKLFGIDFNFKMMIIKLIIQ